MGGLFSKPSKPAPLPPPPTDNSAEVQAAKDAELQRRLAAGRASTILTSTSEDEKDVLTAKKLLGA